MPALWSLPASLAMGSTLASIALEPRPTALRVFRDAVEQGDGADEDAMAEMARHSQLIPVLTRDKRPRGSWGWPDEGSPSGDKRGVILRRLPRDSRSRAPSVSRQRRCHQAV